MKFTLDKHLANSTHELADWPLCKVLFKNERQYPWLLLVPKRTDVTEITDLSTTDQQLLMQEIDRAARIIQEIFAPDKLNIATIGNVVPQLHIHIVGRFKNDPLWPQSIWQSAYQAQPYAEDELEKLLLKLQQKCTQGNK